MLDRKTLRKMAETMPTVTIDSAVLIALLDDADRAPRRRDKREPAENSADDKCARWLFGTLLRTVPKARQPNIAAWANDVRLMRERDGRTHKEICELFLWAHQDSFWCANILSPKALRDKWDRLALQRDRAPRMQPRENVEDRNARLQAEFLGGPTAPRHLQLEG